MFSIRNGWLCYSPYSKFELPELVPIEHTEINGEDSNGFAFGHSEVITVPVCKPGSGSVSFTRTLCRLKWPGEYSLRNPNCSIGEMDIPDSIPPEIVRVTSSQRDCEDDLFLREFIYGNEFPESLARGRLNSRLPPSIAYSLAVNAHIYSPYKEAVDGENTFDPQDGGQVVYPIGGLPAEWAQKTLDVRFIPDRHAIDTLKYLKWQAEAQRHNPLFRGFDTYIRDKLMNVCVAFARMYFDLLADYIYDCKTQYWLRAPWRRCWSNLAAYLFWVGRTGEGRVAHFAGMPYDSPYDIEQFNEACPGLIHYINGWGSPEINFDRAMSHVTGKDPTVGSVEGPAI